MKIEFGWDVVEWSKKNQANIDHLARRYKDRYLEIHGKELDWKKKSRAFERAIINRRGLDKLQASRLRENVWKWRHWYEEEKLEEQKSRIGLENIRGYC